MTESVVRLRANAKINIGLHITGKRSDGYHLMETVYYPILDLYDDVSLELAGEGCAVEMLNLSEPLPLEANLCYRAWKLLSDAVGGLLPGVRICVNKRIPAGAGLGGGSSNAAAVLRGLRTLWGIEMDDVALADLGEKLGADVPFFIYNRPLYACGIGTEFSEIDLGLEGFRIEVRTLAVHSPTPSAFMGLDLSGLPKDLPLRDLLALPVAEWRERVRNDLEGPVFARLPEVAACKASFYADGAVYAAMTGSGSACFAVFAQT